jgi:DNA-binding PadR family transcriptional regulator
LHTSIDIPPQTIHETICGKSDRTLNYHITDVEKYRQKFTFDKQIFEPEIALVTPVDVAPRFKSIVNTPPILGSVLGKSIKLKQTVGEFKSRELNKMFDSGLLFPLATITSTQKFLRHEPKAVSYIASVVWPSLWQLSMSVGSDDIRVSKRNLIKTMSGFYPPYLKSIKGSQFDISQVTEGRINKALEFLEKINFIDLEYEGAEDNREEIVVTSRTKGRNIPDYSEYFKQKEAELRLLNQRKFKAQKERENKRKLAKEEKRKKAVDLEEKGQMTIDNYTKRK